MSKIILLLENCWVVRGKSINNPDKYLYHVVANEWDSSPVHATIYRSEKDAIRLIDDMRFHKRAGFSENAIVEAVPLEGAILTSGKSITFP